MANLKTLASPKTLKVSRKEKVWIIKAAPGPYGKGESVPMGILLREYLGLAENRKEVKFILLNNEVLVDGRRVKDDKLPLGLLDIIAIPSVEKYYLMMVDHRGRLYPKETSKKDAETKLCKLVGKTVLKGGKVQLNLYGGKNMIIDAKDSKKYTVGDTLVLKLADGKIAEVIEKAVGKIALITKGRHAGKVGKVMEMTKSGLNLKSLAKIDCEGEEFMTDTGYIFIVGDKKALI